MRGTVTIYFESQSHKDKGTRTGAWVVSDRYGYQLPRTKAKDRGKGRDMGIQ